MSRHRDAFEEFAERAQDELGESLEKLILYGSVARGEEHDESDVDVLAVVEDSSDREVLEELAFDVSVEHGVFMVPLIKTSDEFRDKKDGIFLREVQDTGETHV